MNILLKKIKMNEIFFEHQNLESHVSYKKILFEGTKANAN